MKYDGRGRVSRVSEIPKGGTEVRKVTFQYESHGAFDRVSRAESSDLGLRIDYKYSEFGNLTKVTRSGHNAMSVTDLLSNVVRYRYEEFRRLDQTISPRLFATKFSDFDTFGHRA